MRRLLAAAVLLVAACDPATPPAAPAPSPSASPTPQVSFTDVTRGDTESVVNLAHYDPNANSVVVEPVLHMSGPQLCERLSLPSSDTRCHDKWASERSWTQYTLPVAAGAKFYALRYEDRYCPDADEHVGRCQITGVNFYNLVDGLAPQMWRLRTHDGSVTEMAEVYEP